MSTAKYGSRLTVIFLLLITIVEWGCCGSLEEEVRVLRKQVEVLGEKRREDSRMIEESFGAETMRKEIEMLRLDLNALKRPKNEKNDIVTIKWLYNMMQEIKTEISEIQTILNSSSLLKSREETKTRLDLLKSDVGNINYEIEQNKRKSAKFEANFEIFTEEFEEIKNEVRETAVSCGKTKNQLKALQNDWNQNWKILNEKSAFENDIVSHPSRHHKIVKQHIIRLEKSSKTLFKENYYLKSKIEEMDEEIRKLQIEVKSQKNKREKPSINNEDKLKELTKDQIKNSGSIKNLTEQFKNYDKLRLSFLELLENVETIESKMDNALPELRKEISKLEVQLQETSTAVNALKEDQKNVISSMKAIGFTVSNLQDKSKKIDDIQEKIEDLIKASAMQNTKLHHHILQKESEDVNVNASKSTINLVEELRSFESEYKSIVNKLPRDCSHVESDGIYLISPGEGETILAECKRGWTVIQKRFDGSLDFNRNWNEYANGFGSATGEHWLGNRNLHYLTKDNCTKLQIDMKDIYGGYWQANYDHFHVSDYSRGFRLFINSYKGNASDAMNYQNLMEFSTIDSDRDISNTHCASNYEGGWWFSHCQHANLNGRNLGLTWFDIARNEWIAVAESEMRVKRRDVC